MVQHSQLGLIQQEMELATKPKAQGFFSKLFEGWTSESEEARMSKRVPLTIGTPLSLFLRMKNLASILPDSKIEFEIDDMYLTGGSDLVNQYGKKVKAANLHRGLRDLEATAIYHNQNGVNYIENTYKLTPVEVHLPYSLILSLEWMADDMLHYVQRRTKELEQADQGEKAANLKIYSVEDMLRIQFIQFTLDARDGKHADLAKIIKSHVRYYGAL